MNGTKVREPAGIHTGGRYATSPHAESTLTLTDDVSRTASPASSGPESPSPETIDKSLVMNGINVHEPWREHQPEELRECFRLGFARGVATMRSQVSVD